VPVNVAPFLWGWPNRFKDRITASGGAIVVLGNFFNGEISPGLDTREDFNRLPSDYGGGIWTNDVDLVVSLLRNRNSAARE
jgi:glycerophosphoryl diester phosphodiesterase